MTLIVIEGLDGAGKSTQIQMLRKHLDSLGSDSNFLHFPRMDKPFYGELISKFLRGEFGRLEDVNPYLVAMLFAGDRNDAAQEIKEWLEQGNYVLLDRYVYSNIAYQCAKLEDREEQEKLKNWIIKLEFEYFNIPRPVLNIFLDVPLSFIESKLNGSRSGDDRKYLNGSTDIHETSLVFQEKVRNIYLELSDTETSMEILNCTDNAGRIMSEETIFNSIIDLLRKKQLVK